MLLFYYYVELATSRRTAVQEGEQNKTKSKQWHVDSRVNIQDTSRAFT